MNDTERLEQLLLNVASAVRYPPTPDIPAGFWRRLPVSLPRRSVPLTFGAAVAAAALLVVVLGIAAISPARDAAADLFHRINIFETSESTQGLPTEITGAETTLERAQTALGRPILQPSGLSLKLERVLLQTYGSVYVAVLFYRSDDSSFALFASNSATGKGLPIGAGANAEPVSGVGREAYWLTGQRIVVSLAPNGGEIIGSERVTSTNTLIWDQDGLVYRIEGDLDEDIATAIAKSVR